MLGIAASGYYRWLKQLPSQRRREDLRLKEKIVSIHQGSRFRYGSPRIHQVLQQQGEQLSRKRVIRLMREENLKAKGKRKFKATTDSQHGHPVAANHVKQMFSVGQPDSIWVGDITYCVPGAQGEYGYLNEPQIYLKYPERAQGVMVH